jgi:GT2 family glycosyltransferase
VEVSVVIPAFRGVRTIANCLESVARAVGSRAHEIIVVESSQDGTAELVRRRFPSVRLIQTDGRLTAGGARNRGAAIARGCLVFFVDQDCTVPIDWIDRLEAHLQKPNVHAAGGSVGIQNPSNLSGAAVYFLEFLYHFPCGGPPRMDNFLVGCNSAYRREVLNAVRFPDVTLGEDVLFTQAVRDQGFGVLYDPTVEVRHQNREGWDEFFQYNRKMGESSAAYHHVLQRWWIQPFLRVPILAFLAPIVILPLIARDLARSRWSYLLQFLLLSPMCLLGNLVWASAFRRRALHFRAQAGRPTESNSVVP